MNGIAGSNTSTGRNGRETKGGPKLTQDPASPRDHQAAEARSRRARCAGVPCTHCDNRAIHQGFNSRVRRMNVARLVLAIIAAAVFTVAGMSMLAAADAMDIHSVGGTSIDEAFFQAFGLFTKAFAMVLFGFAILSVSLGIPRQAHPAAPASVPSPPSTHRWDSATQSVSAMPLRSVSAAALTRIVQLTPGRSNRSHPKSVGPVLLAVRFGGAAGGWQKSREWLAQHPT